MSASVTQLESSWMSAAGVEAHDFWVRLEAATGRAALGAKGSGPAEGLARL